MLDYYKDSVFRHRANRVLAVYDVCSAEDWDIAAPLRQCLSTGWEKFSIAHRGQISAVVIIV